ncbi:MAG: hypothetical protein EDM05_67940 [Leptolyngbya sp. IPPAS B-1204]
MTDIKRPNYFTNQFLVEQDFQDEQQYHRQMRYLHNRELHSWGIAGNGLQVSRAGNQVTVSAGVALDNDGHELVLTENTPYTLTQLQATAVYLTLAFNQVYEDIDRYSGQGVTGDKFTRTTERPTIADTAALPPDDGSVIVLARINLSETNPEASIDYSVRSRSAGALLQEALSLDLDLTHTVHNSTTALSVNVKGGSDGTRYGIVSTASDGANRLGGLFQIAKVERQLSCGVVGTVGEFDPTRISFAPFASPDPNNPATIPFGVLGIVNDSSNADKKFGVSGRVSGGTAGSHYGVQGIAEDGSFNAGGYFIAHAKASDAANSEYYGIYTVATGDGNGTRTGIEAFAEAGGTGDRVGVVGRVSGSNGNGMRAGVLAFAQADGTGDRFGIWSRADGGDRRYGGFFQTSSLLPQSYGVVGATGNEVDIRRQIGSAPCGMVGIISGKGGIGRQYGVCGLAIDGDDTYGVVGVASGGTATTSATGGRFEVTGNEQSLRPYAQSLRSYGVYTAAEGSPRTTDVYGIYAEATNGTQNCYGVYAVAFGAPGSNSYAGYFQGNVHIEGTLTKAGGSFLIDHPLDPLNKTLRHSFVESPEALCLYRGKIRLDGAGIAIIELPAYFAALTHEQAATVSLTPIGSTPFLTSYEWNDTCTAFTVYGAANAEVSYLVMADRDDPVMQQLRQPIETEKGNGNFEKGQLLNPEAYGYPVTMGVHYQSRPDRPDREAGIETGKRLCINDARSITPIS